MEQSLLLLKYLVATEGKQCPPPALFEKISRRHLRLAGRNKAINYFFHFLECKKCGKYLPADEKMNLSKIQESACRSAKAYRREKALLDRFCRKNHLQAILFKDLGDYQDKEEAGNEPYLGSDLDILVEKKSLFVFKRYFSRRGFFLEQEMVLPGTAGSDGYREYKMTNFISGVTVDIHPQIAIPQPDSDNYLTKEKVEKIGEFLFSTISRGSYGLFRLPAEATLFSLIVHFAGTDLFHGLRRLGDIAKLSRIKSFSWEKFWQINRRFSLTNTSLFTLLLAQKFFPTKKNLVFPSIPFRIFLLARLWTLEKIAIFPPINKWGKGPYKSAKMFSEMYFVRRILNEKTIFLRLFRPRTMVFWLILLLGRIKFRHPKPFDICFFQRNK